MSEETKNANNEKKQKEEENKNFANLSNAIRNWILGRRPGYKFYIKSELGDKDPIKKVYPLFGETIEPRENLKMTLEKFGFVFNKDTKKKIYRIEADHSIFDIDCMIMKYPEQK